ncbi:MAG: YtfJ family protein [Minicystis sp.]
MKDAIRDESKKQGTTIYCDWTGAFRKTYQLRRGVSNVVLVGKDGRVIFAAEGPIPVEQRRRLLAMLRDQVERG